MEAKSKMDIEIDVRRAVRESMRKELAYEMSVFACIFTNGMLSAVSQMIDGGFLTKSEAERWIGVPLPIAERAKKKVSLSLVAPLQKGTGGEEPATQSKKEKKPKTPEQLADIKIKREQSAKIVADFISEKFGGDIRQAAHRLFTDTKNIREWTRGALPFPESRRRLREAGFVQPSHWPNL